MHRIVAEADRDLLNLKRTYEEEGLSSPAFSSYAHNMAKDSSRNIIAVYNEKGIAVASFIENVVGVDRSDRDYFLAHLNSTSENLVIGKSIQVQAIGPGYDSTESPD